MLRDSSILSLFQSLSGESGQVGVLERLIRSGQRAPPHPEPARIMAHPEIRVQDNAIDAIVAAAQQILIESAQPVCHERQVTGTLAPASNCPAGATFSQPGLRKSVVSYVEEEANSCPGAFGDGSAPTGLSAADGYAQAFACQINTQGRRGDQLMGKGTITAAAAANG